MSLQEVATELNQSTVQELLSYDRRTGEIRWRRRDLKWFSSERVMNTWNTRYADKPAFTHEARGRRWGCLLGQNVLAHRVVWMWVTGRFPTATGFKNGDGTDLRFKNLVEYGSAAAVRSTKNSLSS